MAPNKTKTRLIRLSAKEDLQLQAIAQQAGISVSAILREAVAISLENQRAIKACMKLYPCTRSEAVASLLCKGLLGIMSVDTYFTQGKDTDQLCKMFWQYVDAIVFEGTSSYYLTNPPSGGYWETEGVTERTVLHRSQIFTVDGIGANMADIAKYPEVPVWLSETE